VASLQHTVTAYDRTRQDSTSAVLADLHEEDLNADAHHLVDGDAEEHEVVVSAILPEDLHRHHHHRHNKLLSSSSSTIITSDVIKWWCGQTDRQTVSISLYTAVRHLVVGGLLQKRYRMPSIRTGQSGLAGDMVDVGMHPGIEGDDESHSFLWVSVCKHTYTPLRYKSKLTILIAAILLCYRSTTD
jgi:hypothetical protein